MKIETLKDRISKTEEKINSKRNTIEKKIALRTKKMAKRDAETDPREKSWLDYDVEHLCDDIDRLTKEVGELIGKLAEYKGQLTAEEEKANSRNVTAIIEFLENWKKHVTAYYHDSFTEYRIEKAKRLEDNKKYCDFVNYGWHEIADRASALAAREEATDKERKASKAFSKRWNFIIRYVERTGFNDDLLAKDLQYEAECKYDDIINRTNAICGKITDARGLEVGNKGDLDGIVIGERGTAKVQTIGAGGYNIQCYHFRTLVHEMK